jgi:hypothetical protein
LIHRFRLNRLGLDNSFAEIAQRGIDAVRQRVYGRRLMLSWNDQACAGVVFEIGN